MLVLGLDCECFGGGMFLWLIVVVWCVFGWWMICYVAHCAWVWGFGLIGLLVSLIFCLCWVVGHSCV